jgi:hypothetical protein
VRNPSTCVASVMLLLVGSSAAIAQTVSLTSEEAALARLDMAQKEMVGRADVKELATLSAPELTINAPTGRILTREQFLAMMRDGRIGAEKFDRTIESVTVSGDIGVVMGREAFTPTQQSELGKRYGAVPLNRRYTNIYQWDHGRWMWIARHANIVSK